MDAEQTRRARQLIDEARETGDVRAIAQALSIVLDELGKQPTTTQAETNAAAPAALATPTATSHGYEPLRTSPEEQPQAQEPPPPSDAEKGTVIEAAPPASIAPPGVYEAPRNADGTSAAPPAMGYEPLRTPPEETKPSE